MFVCIFIENGRKDLCSQREKALRHVLDVIIFVSNTTQILWPFFLDAKIITWKTQLFDINLIRGALIYRHVVAGTPPYLIAFPIDL